MSKHDLEKRVDTLEKEVDVLKNLITTSANSKEWKKTIGMFAKDPGFEEMLRLGKKIRNEENEANT